MHCYHLLNTEIPLCLVQAKEDACCCSIEESGHYRISICTPSLREREASFKLLPGVYRSKSLNLQFLKKMVHSTLSTGVFILILLPFLVTASQDNHHHKKESNHKISHELSLEITVHGVLLWVSMGFLMPIGILVIRMANREEECRRRLNIIFYIHAGLQVLAAGVATVGAILSIKNFENSFSNTHQRMGLTLYGAIWLQALIGFLRPHRGSRGRSFWFVIHWLTGTTIAVLGFINVYTGLKAYHKRTSRSTRLWTIIFTLEVSLFAFLYLLQDKWDYIKKQGVVLGSEPVRPTDQEGTSPTDKSKK